MEPLASCCLSRLRARQLLLQVLRRQHGRRASVLALRQCVAWPGRRVLLLAAAALAARLCLWRLQTALLQVLQGVASASAPSRTTVLGAPALLALPPTLPLLQERRAPTAHLPRLSQRRGGVMEAARVAAAVQSPAAAPIALWCPSLLQSLSQRQLRLGCRRRLRCHSRAETQECDLTFVSLSTLRLVYLAAQL